MQGLFKHITQVTIMTISLVGIVACGGGGSSKDETPVKQEEPAVSVLPDEFVTAFGLATAGTSENYDGDTDDDGLSDDFEITYFSSTISPKLNDTDNNGISDADQDTDSDGLTNLEEQLHGTNPLNSDSDQDGLSDYDEINTHETSPNNPDMDEDGISDGKEIHLGLDPNNKDSDGDGVNDGQQPINVQEKLIGSEQYSITLNIAPENEVEISAQPVLQNDFITSNNQLIIELPDTIDIENTDNVTLTLKLSKTEHTQESVIYGLNPENNLWQALAQPNEHQYDEATETLSLTVQLSNLPFELSVNAISKVASRAKPLSSANETAQNLTTNGAKFHFVTGNAVFEEDPFPPILTYDFLGSGAISSLSFSDEYGNFIGHMAVKSNSNNIAVSNNGGLILNNNQWLEIETDEVVTTGNYTVIAYFEYSNVSGTFLTNQTDNQSEYTYAYTSNTFSDWTALTFTRYETGLFSYQNSQRTQYLQGDYPSAKRHFFIGKPLSNCDENADSSQCQNNTQFQGSLAKIEVYHRLVGRSTIRKKLFNFYYQQFGDQDTDGDGLSDAEELAGVNSNQIYATSRLLADTDGDLLSDSEEIGAYITGKAPESFNELINTKRAYYSDPTSQDTDNDGLNDFNEFSVGTSPTYIDTDNDGLTDNQELEIDTDPLSKDTDNDGISDGIEYRTSALDLDPTIINTIDLGRVPTSIQSIYNGGVNNSYISKMLALYNNYLSLSSNQRALLSIQAGIVASEVNNAKIANVFWGAFKGSEFEAKNGYQSLGQIIGIIASFVPVADIPTGLRDAGINIFQGDFAAAGLDFASILPVAGTVADSVKVTENAIKVAKNLKKIEPESTFKVMRALFNRAEIPNEYKVQWIGAIISAEIVIVGSEILFTDLDENASKSSAKYLVNYPAPMPTAKIPAKKTAKTIKLSADQLLQLTKNTTPSALKALLKQMADKNIQIRDIPDNTPGFVNGIFQKIGDKKHWQYGEDFIEAIMKKDLPDAIKFDSQFAICASGLGLKCGDTPVEGVRKSIKGMRKADAAALITNGPPKKYALREAKVGMVYSSKRIREEIKRDCKMLNGRPAGKNKQGEDVEVAEIKWHLMPSGGTNAKYRFGASQAVLEALQCKGFGSSAKAITVVANLAH